MGTAGVWGRELALAAGPGASQQPRAAPLPPAVDGRGSAFLQRRGRRGRATPLPAPGGGESRPARCRGLSGAEAGVPGPASRCGPPSMRRRRALPPAPGGGSAPAGRARQGRTRGGAVRRVAPPFSLLPPPLPSPHNLAAAARSAALRPPPAAGDAVAGWPRPCLRAPRW